MGRIKTLTRLIEEASALLDETYDNAQWVQWFNNAIDDMSGVIKLEGESSLTKTAGTEVFALPENYISAITVTLPSSIELGAVANRDATSVGYKIKLGNIVLQGADAQEVLLYYYRRPDYMTTASAAEAVDIPDDCVRAVIYYACAQAMLREDETERYNNFVSEYNNARAIAQSMQKNKQSGATGAWAVIR